MAVGKRIARGLDMFRLSLAGAMFGAAASSAVENSMSLEPSLVLELGWAAVGSAACFAILLAEARGDRRRGP